MKCVHAKHVPAEQPAKIVAVVAKTKKQRPLLRAALLKQQLTKYKMRQVSKKQLTTGVSIVAILFLALISSAVIQTPPLVAGLSRWGLFILPFFQQAINNAAAIK